MLKNRWLAALAAGALSLGVVACGDDEETTTGGSGGTGSSETQAESSGEDRSNLSGSIRIDGSSTVQPLAEAAAELFNEDSPNVKITVGGAGTGDGFERYCRGETVISDASRAIEADEFEACAKKNITPVEVQVAIDGLSVIANQALKFPENCIKTGDLKKLLKPKSKIKNYSELGSGYPDAPVSFFTPGTESGTYDYFTEELLETDKEQRTGSEVQTSADDNQIVTGITGSEGALGYVGYAFADENKDKLQILQVDSGDGCVEPTIETIAGGQYTPLSRPLFMYPTTETIKKPEVKAFLSFINEKAQEVAEASDYIPLTEELKAKANANIDSATPVEKPAAE